MELFLLFNLLLLVAALIYAIRDIATRDIHGPKDEVTLAPSRSRQNHNDKKKKKKMGRRKFFAELTLRRALQSGRFERVRSYIKDNRLLSLVRYFRSIDPQAAEELLELFREAQQINLSGRVDNEKFVFVIYIYVKPGIYSVAYLSDVSIRLQRYSKSVARVTGEFGRMEVKIGDRRQWLMQPLRAPVDELMVVYSNVDHIDAHIEPLTEEDAQAFLDQEVVPDVDWRPTETVPEDYYAL
jgi:hypothetical protein